MGVVGEFEASQFSAALIQICANQSRNQIGGSADFPRHCANHQTEFAIGPYASLLFIAFQIRPKFSTVYAAHIRSMAIWGVPY